VSEWDPAATDGLQNLYGFLFAPVTTGGSATLPGVALVRAFSANSNKLTWKSGATTAQKTAATIAIGNSSAVVIR